MGPKKAAGKTSKKAEQKAKEKVIVDKTFGLKNKGKSKKVQQYIQTVKTQVENSGNRQEMKKKKEMEEAKKLKQMELEKKKEIDSLFQPVVEKQQVAQGVDPKSIVCEFFKQGKCTKGARCKFSHDLSMARKSEKINIYTDVRRTDAENEETNEDWSEDKLRDVVSKKQTSDNQNLPTEIICKFFLEAIENRKYGWFWECPNGAGCKYRHALPPGYQLKSKKKAEDEEEEEEDPLEDLLEQERAKLTTHTPMNLERFLEWKKRKAEEKEKKDKEAEEKRRADIKAGKSQMSGREMFVFNPDLFVDDDLAAGADAYAEEDDDLAVPHHVIEATGTSLTRIAITKKGEIAQGEEAAAPVAVNESLFAGEDDIPDEDLDDE